MSAQTILRVKKFNSLQHLKTAASHDTRAFFTPNVDPGKSVVILAGATHPDDVIKLTRQKIGSQKIRKNAVVGAEIILSASPEYFRPDNPSAYGEWDEEKLNVWEKASSQWLEQKLGHNILQTSLHLDEATPHIHCLWVPLNKQGKLSYWTTEFGGTRDSLSKIQDSYAQALEPLGIERGIKGSKTTHTKIKQYYENINKTFSMPELNARELLTEANDNETGKQYRERAVQYFQPQLDLIKLQLAMIQKLEEERNAYRQKAIAAERQRQALTEKAALADEITTGISKTLIPLATTITSLSPNHRIEGKEWSFSRKTEVIFVHRHTDNFQISLNEKTWPQVSSELKPSDITALQDLSGLMCRWVQAKYQLSQEPEL
ncbi:plasmid recombination protein [Ancylothrix sp. C2]|uniref:MobV family relaxase n=1 Tax=Ancylothrix sp. D3o TaxID=2953691 RepID=UPI0021BB44C7|nr:MobV family relaxase [Ancylothrix sp. D3o]MCT7953513.1 plasmid recombination protein [Ancylothrix sp. D3o]